MKEEYIDIKIEPFLHAVPIVFSLIGGITILAKDAFHPNMTYCFIGSDPSTCDGLECASRTTSAMVLFIIFSAAPLIILPTVIVATMGRMYQAVSAQEKKLKGYGKAAIRANIKARSQEQDDATKENLCERFKRWWTKSMDDKRKKPNMSQRQLRSIASKARSYSLAFFVTYLFPLIISIQTMNGLESGPAVSVIARILFPLQGFFNFIMFMQPKVIREHSKKSNENISWCMAFVKAVQSRGPRQKRLKVSSPRTKLRECLGRFIDKVGAQARKKKIKASREVEEEKCEIVPPSSIRTSDFTPRQAGSSMHASNVSGDPVSRGDVESGSFQQCSPVNEEEKCEIAATASQPNL